MGVRKVLTIVFAAVLCLSLVPLWALGADRGVSTVSISLTGDVIVPSFNLASGEEIDYVYYQVRESGSYTWRDVSRIDDYYESIHIPSSLFVAGNSFRLRVQIYDDPDGYTYSNVVSVPVPYIEFQIYIKDNNTVSWTWTGYPVTLHFIWYDNWDVIWDENSVELPPDFPNQPQTFPITQTSYDTLYYNQYTSSFNQLRYTLGIYATCVIAGHTYTTSTVFRIGIDTMNTSPPETGRYYDPLTNDLTQHVNLIYRSSRNSRIWYYVLSALVVCLPCVGVGFILKRF